MTRDEVIEIWGKANGWSIKEFNITITELERFAQLVAAHEREVCAKVCDDLDEKNWSEYGRHKTGYSEQIRTRGNK